MLAVGASAHPFIDFELKRINSIQVTPGVVDGKADEASYWIVGQAKSGDIVVIADVPLAALAQKRGLR